MGNSQRAEVDPACLFSMLTQRKTHRLFVAIAIVNLALIVVNALIAAGLHSPLEFLDRQLDLREESNLAVWFSSMQLLLVGVVAALVAFAAPQESRLVHRIAWGGVALLMLALS